MRAFALLAAVIACAPVTVAAAQMPAPVAGTAAPERPAADVARDALRKPAAMLAFARVAPGAQVLDLIPGGGYFTRIFAKAVGPQGHVYADVPKLLSEKVPTALPTMQAIAAAPGYGNVSVVQSFSEVAPASLDLVWTSQNYHDLRGNLSPDAMQKLNHVVFTALKPGGYYVVVDHVARAGSGYADSKTLHRIDPELVVADALAAGFVLDARSDALRNPADLHDKIVFDPTIRGHTDQFALRFRKPG